MDSRLEVYRKLSGVEAPKAELAHSAKLQVEIWSMAVGPGAWRSATRGHESASQGTQSNDRYHQHPDHSDPDAPAFAIYGLLFTLAMAGAIFAGHGMAPSKIRSWIHMIGFAAAIAVAVDVIMDLEYPRHGLIRLDAFDKC